jgi:hypothetical protein
MQYLDSGRLAAISASGFRAASPFPWINPAGLITEAGYRALRESLPAVELFERKFGVRRAHGQQPHDRYTLEYGKKLPVAAPWHEFVAELESDSYREFIRRLFGIRRFFLSLHWHYTPAGCSVSPHCDAKHKAGSHIFYFNTAEDWDSSWGGETLILDDGGRFPRSSAPRFEDFDRTLTPESMGNHSVLFMRRGNSWHGVREIRCPPDRLRKVFIVVINLLTPKTMLRRLLGHGGY